jgi:hypothetical protein
MGLRGQDAGIVLAEDHAFSSDVSALSAAMSSSVSFAFCNGTTGAPTSRMVRRGLADAQNAFPLASSVVCRCIRSAPVPAGLGFIFVPVPTYQNKL